MTVYDKTTKENLTDYTVSTGTMSGSFTAGYDIETGKLLIGMKEGTTPANGNYKLTASALFENDMPSLKKNFTNSVHNKTPQIKLSAKGSIDILNPHSTVYYTPKLSNVSGTITGVSLSGSNAEAFRAELLADNRIQLTLAHTQNSNAKITANTKYSLQFCFTLDNSLLLTAYPTTVYIKPIQSKAKITASSTKLTMDYFEKELDFLLTQPETAEIERVVLADTQNFNYSYDAKALTLKDNHNLTAGKTYTLQFNIFCKTEAKTTNPVTVKIKVTIPK